MRKRIYILSFFSIIFIAACSSNHKEKSEVPGDEKPLLAGDRHNARFANFLNQFDFVGKDNINNINIFFNNKFLAKNEQHHMLNSAELNEYLKTFVRSTANNFFEAYYAYKITLSDSMTGVIYYINSGGKEEDTSAFLFCVYTSSGDFCDAIPVVASNLSGEMPNYNMQSSFQTENNALAITTYEYSFDKNYFSNQDSIYEGGLTSKEYIWDSNKRKMVLLNVRKENAKMTLVFNNPDPVVIKLLVPKLH